MDIWIWLDPEQTLEFRERIHVDRLGGRATIGFKVRTPGVATEQVDINAPVSELRRLVDALQASVAEAEAEIEAQERAEVAS